MNDNIFLFIAVICVIIIVLLPCIKTYIKIPLALAALSYVAIASHDKLKIIGGRTQRDNNSIWHGRHIDNFDVSNYWIDSKMVLTKMFKRLGKRYNHDKTETENIYELYKLQNENEKWGAYSNRFNRNFIERKFGKNIIDVLGKLKNVNIYIDYGCGGGKSMSDFIELLHPSKSYCVDVEDFRKQKYKNITEFIKNENIETFDKKFANNSVELISAMQSLHHVSFDSDNGSFYSRLKCVIDQLTNKLKPGGYLLIREHDVRSKKDIYPVIFEHLLYELHEETDDNMSVDEVNEWVSKFHDKHKGWYFSAKTLQKMLESHGMKLISRNYKQGKNPSRIYNALYQKK